MRTLLRTIGKDFIDLIKNLALVASLITVDALIYDGKGFIFNERSADSFFWIFFWFAIVVALLACALFIANVHSYVLDSPYSRHATSISALMICPILSALLFLVLITAKTIDYVHLKAAAPSQAKVAATK